MSNYMNGKWVDVYELLKDTEEYSNHPNTSTIDDFLIHLACFDGYNSYYSLAETIDKFETNAIQPLRDVGFIVERLVDKPDITKRNFTDEYIGQEHFKVTLLNKSVEDFIEIIEQSINDNIPVIKEQRVVIEQLLGDMKENVNNTSVSISIGEKILKQINIELNLAYIKELDQIKEDSENISLSDKREIARIFVVEFNIVTHEFSAELN